MIYVELTNYDYILISNQRSSSSLNRKIINSTIHCTNLCVNYSKYYILFFFKYYNLFSTLEFLIPNQWKDNQN